MYIWNDIKINIHGNNIGFINAIDKYINAVSVSDESKCDIEVLVTTDTRELQKPGPSAKLLKSLEYESPDGMFLDIFSEKRKIWYIYRDIASVLVDYENNSMIVAVDGLPLQFEYYNVLIFLFHPIGGLMENFGFFRMHSSSGSIDGRALLVTGTSGSGKSTSAFSIPLNKGIIIADDLSYIRLDNGRYTAHAFTALVKLRKDSIRRFYPELMSKKAFIEYEDEAYFRADDINNHRTEKSFIKCIAALNKTGEKPSSHTLVRPSVIVPHLFPHTISTSIPENAERKFMFITGMLDDIECYRIDFGTDMLAYNNVVRNILGVNKGG